MKSYQRNSFSQSVKLVGKTSLSRDLVRIFFFSVDSLKKLNLLGLLQTGPDSSHKHIYSVPISPVFQDVT